MIKDVSVTIPQSIYQRVRQLALARNQPVSDVLANVLDEALPPNEEAVGAKPSSTDDKAADREMHAYIALHPMLKEKFLGMHVAIHNGQLIDYDQDYEALYKRIDKQFPDEFVWLATVEEEPMRTLVFRSPRFVRAM
jgi:hypothetical protein